ILSGYYGVLKPLDLIQPYRLEMGTKLQVNGSENLYKFWSENITDSIIDEMSSEEILINLASNEYFDAFNNEKFNGKIISPVFKDFKNGKLKIISFYAKKARGLMVRYIVDNNISNYNDLLGFNLDNYAYNESETIDENKPVFTR
ncbi:MAG: YaaA family protein, partial [Cryomorphaceae bacterium]